MKTNVPVDPADIKPSEEGKTQGNRTLNIKTYHHHGNDLAEIARIADKNPALAEKIIDNSEAADKRSNVSYRFGLVSTSTLLTISLLAVTYIAVNQGVLVTISASVLVLAIALTIRVILTGEWSETTWFGKAINLLARALGSKSESGE